MSKIVPPKTLTQRQFLGLFQRQLFGSFPQPLRLIIEGSTGSGKTFLAQQLALALIREIRDIEVWSSFSDAFPLISGVPVYKPSHPFSKEILPSIWEKRASFLLNNAAKPKYILIDEIPSLLRLETDNFFIHFLREFQNTNIVLSTQYFETEAGMLKHSLNRTFSLIRLGLNAERYAGFVLKNSILRSQLKAAQYPCLFQNRAYDLAGIA